jgi:hypothetical protein
MGKMLMILVVGMGTVFGMAGLQLQRSNLRTIDNASTAYERTQARDLAMSGFELAVMELAKDSNWNNGYALNNIAAGALRVTVEETGSRYPNGPDEGLTAARMITAVGRVNGQTATVQSVVQIPSTDVVPPAMRYALMSDKTLELTGSTSVTDDGNPAWNADIHTNENMVIKGNNTVTGYGTYSGVMNSTPAHRANSTFSPNVPTGGPVHYKRPPVAIPDIDPTKFSHLATRTSYSNVSLAGNTKLGSKDAPEIWYIKGNLTLSGTIEGYGVFIVEGNITLKGNTKIHTIDPSGNNLGLYTTGNVNTMGNVHVEAQVLAQGSFNSNGNVTLVGSATVKGDIDIKGNVKIRYRPVTTDLTKQFWPGEAERPRVLSMYEQ